MLPEQGSPSVAFTLVVLAWQHSIWVCAMLCKKRCRKTVLGVW